VLAARRRWPDMAMAIIPSHTHTQTAAYPQCRVWMRTPRRGDAEPFQAQRLVS